ncbi:hypothetical protein GJAV_G00019930 [Gymnothorax javanicus]|nr:hypothetical protein GJAV_G00019930 [Gymnothorax javanicus]
MKRSCFFKSIMRRSGAPSQLYGNMAKRPRFVPPGATQTSMDPRPEPAAKPPHLLACNLVNKEKHDTPLLSNALAKILSAVPSGESKENCTALHDCIHSEEHHPENKLGTAVLNVCVPIELLFVQISTVRALRYTPLPHALL